LPERVWAMERALRDMQAEITCLLCDMHRNPAKREEHEAVVTGPRHTPRGHEELLGRNLAETDLNGKITGIISDVQAAFRGLPGQARSAAVECPTSVGNSMVEPIPDAFKRASREDLMPCPHDGGSVMAMCGSSSQACSTGPLHKTWSVPNVYPTSRVRAPSPVQTTITKARGGGASPCSPPRQLISPSASPPRSSWAAELPCEPGEPRTPLQKRHSASAGNFRDAASPRHTVPPPRVIVHCPSNLQQAMTPRMPGPLAQRRGGSPDCGPGRSTNAQARQCLVNSARTRLAGASPLPVRSGSIRGFHVGY